MAPQLTLSSTLLVSAVAALLVSRTTSLSTVAAAVAVYSTVLPIYTYYCCYIYPFYISPLRHIPTVPGSPLWGSFFTIINREVGTAQREWHEKYGPVVRYFFPFGAERLTVADDDALKHITLRNSYNYRKPSRAKQWMVRILGDGVLLADGAEHAHQRKSLAPGFSISSIRALAPIFWQKAMLMSGLWQQEMRTDNVKSKSFEILDWLNRTTLDIIGEAGFGSPVNSLENPDAPLREAYRLVFAFDNISRMLHGLNAFMPITKYIPSRMNRDMEESRRIIKDSATAIINEKQDQAKAQTTHKDIIALIVKDDMKSKQAGEAGLSFETMRDQIMTFLGAGHDTTATGVAWTLHLLTKHPEVQDKLRAEIKQHMPFLFDNTTRNDPAELAKADADLLPFLDNVCRESLRYIPPIPMTVREVVDDDTLAGYTIPAGTIVYVLANAINRLESYWGPTANEFIPDRWDNLPDTYTPQAYMTFLAGPRGCIGRKFAETEMKVLLCSLLSLFMFERDLSVADPEDWKMWRLVLRPKEGITLKVSYLDVAA